MYDQIILLGVLASILFSELTGGLSPAGLVVPGYIVMNLHAPLRIVCTIVIALLSMLLVRLLSRATILYGRRRFAVLVLTAYLLQAGLSALRVLPMTVDVIGCILPGIISRELDRQGVVKTLLSLAVVTLSLALVLALLGVPVLPR